VQVTVEVPRHLNKRQKELLEQFAATMGESNTPRSASFFDKVKQMFGGEPAKETAPGEPQERAS